MAGRLQKRSEKAAYKSMLDIVKTHQNNVFYEKALKGFMREHKLTYNESLILFIVFVNPDIKIKDLADCFGGAQSNTSVLCKNLETRDLLVRTKSAVDERCFYLTLTERAHKVCDEVLALLKSRYWALVCEDNEELTSPFLRSN